ncbi:MAG: hypothetical protein PHT33_08310 [bacterium]|nr:hypothetical protein [bacterium]
MPAINKQASENKDMIKIACCSPTLRPGDKDFNIDRMERCIAAYKDENVDLFIFPENNIAGGLWSDGQKEYKDLAEAIPGGPSCNRVLNLAREYETTICSGIIESDRDSLYISHVLCGPGGLIGCQRKLIPQNPEKSSFFAAGDRLNGFQLFGYTCVVLACADSMFPETTVIAGMLNASLILCPTDCFHLREREVVTRLLCSQSMGAGAATVAVFGHGHGADEVLATVIVDEEGAVAASETTFGDEDKVVIASICLKQPRQVWGGFQARRQMLLRHLLDDGTGDTLTVTGAKEIPLN